MALAAKMLPAAPPPGGSDSGRAPIEIGRPDSDGAPAQTPYRGPSRRWTGCRPDSFHEKGSRYQPAAPCEQVASCFADLRMVACAHPDEEDQRGILSPQRRTRAADTFPRFTGAESAARAEATIGDDPRAPLTRRG